MNARMRPSPALVISLIALFVALGGTSYAAITSLPANSVGTRQLKNNAVTSGKVGNGAITAKKINAGAVWHEIGASGEPAFQNGWTNETVGSDVTAAFSKDPFGVVHLKGIIKDGNLGAVFTLPAGYRPGRNLSELVWRSASGTAQLVVYANGDVVIFNGSGVAGLDGVTFTAGE